MTIKKLEQYTKIKNEISMLENRIENLQSMGAKVVSDSVVGSSPYFPYTQHTIKITGIEGNTCMRIGKIRERLRNRKVKLEYELDVIEEFIDTVADSDIRQIIQLKYIDGLSWLVVSRRVYGSPSENRARMRITRFFEKK